jgi:phenylacetate-coenzyme A ligase PaaK-like adenylate-forming protein
LTNYAQDILKVTDLNFEENALQLFDYQYEAVEVYRNYCKYLGVTQPKRLNEIPFLPIQFFKSQHILANGLSHEKVFMSSGTTEGRRSQHFIPDLQHYENSFLKTFTDQIGRPEDAVFIALLPNYVEQGNSSLVYMIEVLIKNSQHQLSGFYLNKLEEVQALMSKARSSGRKVVVFGVSFALLDLAEKHVDMSGAVIIETGGMKGRRKEIIREELHSILCSGLQVEKIYSEYGMTELLSQAYTNGGDFFTPPSWMKVLIRDINDPLFYKRAGRTGGVNVIDLANQHSCAFIATDDLGVKNGDRFKILGRFDQSDIRGCNLLVN